MVFYYTAGAPRPSHPHTPFSISPADWALCDSQTQTSSGQASLICYTWYLDKDSGHKPLSLHHTIHLYPQDFRGYQGLAWITWITQPDLLIFAEEEPEAQGMVL